MLDVIDEVNTPDSSRLYDAEEWEQNYSGVVTTTATGRYNTVTALLEVQQEFKIKKFSQQHAMLDLGFNPAKDTEEPKLSEDTDIVEDALFGMEDRRPPLGSASQSESDPSESFFFGNLCVLPLILLLLQRARMTACRLHRLDS